VDGPIHTTVVTVAYGSEEWLGRSVDAALAGASQHLRVDVVLVDNGCTDDGVDRLVGRPDVTVLRPGANLGFAAGCNLGVAKSTGDVICLVNPDAVLAPGALAALSRVALEPGVGIATGCVLLADRPDRVNSAGNDVHYTGVSWSGGFGEPVVQHAQRRHTAAASGAAMAISRQCWEELGGLDELFFAYYEDADLSLRAWQRGWKVVYEPSAVIEHRYEFGRNPTKHFLLERNRALLVSGCFETRTLVVLAPMLLALEVLVFLLATVQGWAGAKAKAWSWLVRNRKSVRARRSKVQDARTVPDRELSHLFSERLDPANFPLPAPLLWLNGLVAIYWRIARRFL
jgi:GT2 family glycosyltransferase